MFKFGFNKKAVKELGCLLKAIRRRILWKIKFYSLQENPLRFAEKIKDYEFGEYRFRIGDYRVLFDVRGDTVLILKVGHRREVYK